MLKLPITKKINKLPTLPKIELLGIVGDSRNIEILDGLNGLDIR